MMSSLSCAAIADASSASVVRKRHVQGIAISSFMLDSLMSSSPDLKGNTPSEKNGSSLEISFKKETKLSAMNGKTSALRFTPPQVHKVNKRSRDKCHSSSRNCSNSSPIVKVLQAKSSKDDETIRSKRSQNPDRSRSPEPSRGSSNMNTTSRDRSSDASRKSSSSNTNISSRHSSSERHSKSHSISFHETSHSSESGFESFRNSEKSPARSSISQCNSSFLSRYSSSSSASKSQDGNKSTYVTPEGSPFSMRSSEGGNRNSSFKRSLSDEQQDDSHSNNSSFNNSSYYTPGSSPSNYNSAKRMKIRWSDSSAFNQHNSSSSDSRLNTSCTSEQRIQPELIGFQMVGDSQFCRFGQQLLGLQRVPMPNCPGRIGICISGQTITDLHKRIRDNFYPISEKVIVMIGTNDFLRNVNVSRMCEELSALIKTMQKSASNIILLTLPPIPKLANKSTTHFELLDVYNRHIRSMENGETLRIADISPFYMTSPPYQRCRMHLFELFFGGSEKRHDLIHLNRLGLEVIRKYILDKFL